MDEIPGDSAGMTFRFTSSAGSGKSHNQGNSGILADAWTLTYGINLTLLIWLPAVPDLSWHAVWRAAESDRFDRWGMVQPGW